MQVFRKADPSAIDLISKLLEYTPTQRLSAVDAMVQPFFDELRDPQTRLPDSRHPNGATRDLPELFNFTHHGECYLARYVSCLDPNVPRTVHRAPSEPAARTRAHQAPAPTTRLGFRIAEFQAFDKGPDDGAAGLNQPCLHALRHHVYSAA